LTYFSLYKSRQQKFEVGEGGLKMMGTRTSRSHTSISYSPACDNYKGSNPDTIPRLSGTLIILMRLLGIKSAIQWIAVCSKNEEQVFLSQGRVSEDFFRGRHPALLGVLACSFYPGRAW